MKKVEIKEITLHFNSAEKFEEIKNHMESCDEGETEITNEDVAQFLIELGIQNYRYL